MRSSEGLAAAPPAKRNVPSVSTLQRDLQQEKELTARLKESVEQLRLELQMMGRLLASTREQIVASGVATIAPNVAIRQPPAPAPVGMQRTQGRSKSEAKLMQRLHDEISEGKGNNRRLNDQVDVLQQKLQLVASSKKEMLTALSEMGEYIASQRN